MFTLDITFFSIEALKKMMGSSSEKKTSSNTEYICYRTADKILIDGNLEENCWHCCQKSPPFGDIVDGKPGFFHTQAALLWDEKYLYVAFWIQEPFLTAELTEQDSLIYSENDVEIFIAADHCYYEFEINALGTIYEAFFIDQKAFFTLGFHENPDFDMKKQRVDILGGFQDANRFHPPNPNIRWVFRDWDYKGLKTGVNLRGTLNDNSDFDEGWTVEVAFPWATMSQIIPDKTFPPKEGDMIRMDFSRFERLFVNGKELEPHPGWTWTPHGKYDSHLPEKFTKIYFSEKTV